MLAYCWASGVIGFGRDLPAGALPIARCRSSRRLRDKIEGIARLAYDNTTLLVPGIPEADSQVRKVQALETFISRVARRAEPGDGVTVFTRAHRWPVTGKGQLR